MKKKILLMVLVLALALSACSNKADNKEKLSTEKKQAKDETKKDEMKDEMKDDKKDEKKDEMKDDKKDKMNTSEEKTFTLEELSKFNGKNGAKAYVAVDGVVYDVTDSPKWKEGEHQGAVKAGADLTKEIKEMSPHGVKALEKLPVVGKLVK